MPVVAVIVAVIATSVFLIATQTTFGRVTLQQPTTQGRFIQYNFFFSSSTSPLSGLQATTTSATSTNVTGWFDNDGRYVDGKLPISGAKKVSFYFGRGDTTGQGNSGSSRFNVQVSPDGSNWYYWGKWVQNASTSAGFVPISVTNADFAVNGTSTEIATMDLTYDSFLYARCIVVETTDGEHTCMATAEF
jgi:hypothetical protein